MVNTWPAQIVPLLAVKVGFGLTVIVVATEFEAQPLVPVPITEYDVVLAGVTTEPLLKAYVLAPVARSVKLCPSQMVPLFTVMVGSGFTVTVPVLFGNTAHPVRVPVTV